MSLAAIRRASHPVLVRHEEQRAASLQNRAADAITRFAGSMWFVYIHIAGFVWWLVSDGAPFDDPFPYGLLTMIVSLEAIFLSTFVMISQNRADERRRELADHEWQLVQEEKTQNDELIMLSRQMLALTQEVHRLSSEMHHITCPAELTEGSAG